jgi:hypothetical protein
VIGVVDSVYHPPYMPNGELAMIAGKSVLEGIQVSLYLVPQGSCSTESEDWPAFDALLTSPDVFPMLRRVSITIEWFARLNADESNALKED